MRPSINLSHNLKRICSSSLIRTGERGDGTGIIPWMSHKAEQDLSERTRAVTREAQEISMEEFLHGKGGQALERAAQGGLEASREGSG